MCIGQILGEFLNLMYPTDFATFRHCWLSCPHMYMYLTHLNYSFFVLVDIYLITIGIGVDEMCGSGFITSCDLF